MERSFAARVAPARAATRSPDLRITGFAVTTAAGHLPALAPGPRLDDHASPAPTTRAAVARSSDPEATDAFKRAALRRSTRGLRFSDWHEVRDTITDQARTNTIIIGVNTLLALIAVGFTVATVISGRVLAQRREIGLLKAIGITPRGVVGLLVAEYVALAARRRPARPGRRHRDRAAAPGADVQPARDRDAERLPAAHAARRARADRRRRRAVRRDPGDPGRPPEHRRRPRARPRLALRRRLASGQGRRRAQAPRHRPPRGQGRLHEPCPRRPDHRRADDDGHHARRRALDGGDLQPRDRGPRAARQAVGHAGRGRRPGPRRRGSPASSARRRSPGLQVSTPRGRAAGARGRRRLRRLPLRRAGRAHVRQAGRGDRRPRLPRPAAREGRRPGHGHRGRAAGDAHARRPPRRARQRRRGRDLPRRDAARRRRPAT